MKLWSVRRWCSLLAFDLAIVALGVFEGVAWGEWWATAGIGVCGVGLAAVALWAIRALRWLEAHRPGGGPS